MDAIAKVNRCHKSSGKLNVGTQVRTVHAPGGKRLCSGEVQGVVSRSARP